MFVSSAVSAVQGMGAAVELFQPHEVSGTLVSLLRELLGDVYADIRLAALQQVMPIGEWCEQGGQQQLYGALGVLCAGVANRDAP